MRVLQLLSSLLAYLTLASATALTYKLAANEKSCFFTNVQQKGAKVAFYFAVGTRNFRPSMPTIPQPGAVGEWESKGGVRQVS